MGNFFCGNQTTNQLQFLDSFTTPNVFISQSGRPIGRTYCDNKKIKRSAQKKYLNRQTEISMYATMKRRERTNSFCSKALHNKSKVSLGKVCRDHMEKDQAKYGNRLIIPRHPSEYQKLDLLWHKQQQHLKTKIGVKDSIQQKSTSQQKNELFDSPNNQKSEQHIMEGDITFQPLIKKQYKNTDGCLSLNQMTFSDADVDITTSQDGEDKNIYIRQKTANLINFCQNSLKQQFGGENSLLDDGNDSLILNSMDKMRSNSECLYCTGQAVEKLFDGPDFVKDLNYNNEDQDLDDQVYEDELGIIFNDGKSNFFSHINYDQYELQQPIQDEIDFISPNGQSGFLGGNNNQLIDKLESLEGNDCWQRDYLLEIYTENDHLKDQNSSPNNNDKLIQQQSQIVQQPPQILVQQNQVNLSHQISLPLKNEIQNENTLCPIKNDIELSINPSNQIDI